MSAAKKGFNPWIATVILGVITILFSLYALQSQTELIAGREQIEQLKKDLQLTQTMAEQKSELADRNAREAQVQQALAMEISKQLDDCRNSKVRK